MVAAMYNNKEVLLHILAPFIMSKAIRKIEKLLHHRNHRGQRLLGLVVHHRQSLLVAHGILVRLFCLLYTRTLEII